MAKLTKTQKALLEVILEQLNSASYTYASAVDVKPLVDAGLLVSDPNGPGEDGLIAVAVPVQVAGDTDAQPVVEMKDTDAQPVKEVAGYVIEEGIPVPARKRSGGMTEVYPFSKLAVGQSFFVFNPGKTLSGTVSTATRRYAVAVEGETRTNRKGNIVPLFAKTREFQLFEVKAGQKYDNGFIEKADGARIYRTK